MKTTIIIISILSSFSVYSKNDSDKKKTVVPVSKESQLKINEVLLELDKEVKVKGKVNKRRIYELLSTASKRLEENFSNEELVKVLKFYESYNEIDSTHYFVEMFVDLYQKKKKEFDSAVKDALSPKQKEEFMRKLKIAITESTEGNG